MALLDGELARIKAELGWNLLAVGAEPWVSVSRYFEQIVQPYLSAGAVTSSATAVTAASAGPVPVTLTLASGTGFAALCRVVVDVDGAQESATVQSISGSAITLPLALAHSGTYPVTVEGGEAIVREYLARCRLVATQIGKFGARAGIKSLDKDDVVFFGGREERSGLRTLQDLQRHLRSELCSVIFGVGSLSAFGGAGGRVSVY